MSDYLAPTSPYPSVPRSPGGPSRRSPSPANPKSPSSSRPPSQRMYSGESARRSPGLPTKNLMVQSESTKYEEPEEQQEQAQGLEEAHADMGGQGEPDGEMNPDEMEEMAGADEMERELMEAQTAWNQMSDLLTELPKHLKADDDVRIIEEAEQNLQDESDRREKQTDQVREELRQLSATYAEARANSQRPESQPTPAEHEAQMIALEDQQLTTAKQVNEETLLAGKKEAEVVRLKDELKDVEAWDVEKEGKSLLDSKVIHLKLFKDMGFSLVPNEKGGSDSLLIRNDMKNDIHSIAVDASKSRFYQANLFWNLASE